MQSLNSLNFWSNFFYMHLFHSKINNVMTHLILFLWVLEVYDSLESISAFNHHVLLISVSNIPNYYSTIWKFTILQRLEFCNCSKIIEKFIFPRKIICSLIRVDRNDLVSDQNSFRKTLSNVVLTFDILWLLLKECRV